MSKLGIVVIGLFVTVAYFIFPVTHASAYVIEKLNLQARGNVIVGPGRTELFLSPGDSYNQEVIVTNASGVKKQIDITVEDMQGTDSNDTPFNFLGDKKGPYSVKDYITPEISRIILNPGERLRMQAVIAVPGTAEPGDLNGAIMVAASNVAELENNVPRGSAAGGLKVITRVASLLYITVKGDALQSGLLQSFTAGNFYEQGPVSLKIVEKNDGNVHLTPYGTITVKNMLGQQVSQKEVEPFFTLPRSTKTRIIAWNSNFLIGRYTASLSLNRGYGDKVDYKSYSFWVIPWKIILIVLVGLILLVLFLKWIAGHFELKKSRR